MTEGSQGIEITRRDFLFGAGLTGVSFAAGGLVGFGLGDSSGGGSPPQQATPGSGPQPSGKVTTSHPAALTPATAETTKQLTLEATENTVDIAAGVPYNAWTFGNTVPGPVVHMRQGRHSRFHVQERLKPGPLHRLPLGADSQERQLCDDCARQGSKLQLEGKPSPASTCTTVAPLLCSITSPMGCMEQLLCTRTRRLSRRANT